MNITILINKNDETQENYLNTYKIYKNIINKLDFSEKLLPIFNDIYKTIKNCNYIWFKKNIESIKRDNSIKYFKYYDKNNIKKFFFDELMKPFEYNENISNEKNSGYIYCMENIIFKYYGDNVYKLGKTISLKSRMDTYSTPYPEKSKYVLTSKKLFNMHYAEDILFDKLEKYKMEKDREFVKCDLSIIKQKFDEIEKLFEGEKELIFENIKINKYKLRKEKYMRSINNLLDSYEFQSFIDDLFNLN